MMNFLNSWKNWFGLPTQMAEEKRTQTQELKQVARTAKPLQASQSKVRKPLQLKSIDDFVKEFVDGNDPAISSGPYKKWLDEMVNFSILLMIGQEKDTKNSIADKCSTLVAGQLLAGISDIQSYLYQEQVSFPSIKFFIKYLTDNQPLPSDDNNILFSRLQASIFKLMLKSDNQKKINTVIKDLVLKDIDIYSLSDDMKITLQKRLTLTIPGLIFKSYLIIDSDSAFDIDKGLSGFASYGDNLDEIIKNEKVARLEKIVQDEQQKQIQLQKTIRMIEDKKLAAELKAKIDDRLKQLNHLKHQQYLNFCFGGVIPLLISYGADADLFHLIYPLFICTHESYRLLEAHQDLDQQIKYLTSKTQKNDSSPQESMKESEKKLDALKTEEEYSLGQLNSLKFQNYWLLGKNALSFMLYSLNYLNPHGLIYFLVLNSIESYDLLTKQENVYQQIANLRGKIFETTAEQKVIPSTTTAATTFPIPSCSSSALLSQQAKVQEQHAILRKISNQSSSATATSQNLNSI